MVSSCGIQLAAGAETANQHSCGTGFVAAQYNAKTDLVRIGIADNGIGVRESFKGNQSPHFREGFDDRDCLELVLKPEISSRNHLKGPYDDTENAGVGLSIVEATASETYGHFVLGSGRSVYIRNGQNEGVFRPSLPLEGYKGTVVSVAFSRKEVYCYTELLMDAKRQIGLIPADETTGEGLFQ